MQKLLGFNKHSFVFGDSMGQAKVSATNAVPVLALGSLSKSLRLALIRLPEVNFPKNVTLRMCVGCIQP